MPRPKFQAREARKKKGCGTRDYDEQAAMLAAPVSTLVFLALAPMAVQAAQCVAQSGAGTAALVELYTSEGCSSCPPADRWLSGLAKRPSGSVVPLALHV